MLFARLHKRRAREQIGNVPFNKLYHYHVVAFAVQLKVIRKLLRIYHAAKIGGKQRYERLAKRIAVKKQRFFRVFFAPCAEVYVPLHARAFVKRVIRRYAVFGIRQRGFFRRQNKVVQVAIVARFVVRHGGRIGFVAFAVHYQLHYFVVCNKRAALIPVRVLLIIKQTVALMLGQKRGKIQRVNTRIAQRGIKPRVV